MLELITADPGGRLEEGIGLRSLGCWDCGFEFHRTPGCLPFWMLSVVRGFCDRPIPRPEESYWLCVCVCVCVSLSVIRCNNTSVPTMG